MLNRRVELFTDVVLPGGKTGTEPQPANAGSFVLFTTRALRGAPSTRSSAAKVWSLF